MMKYIEKRTFGITSPIIGDINRLRRKDDLELKEKLLNSIAGTSRNFSYLMPVSEKQVETELARGYIRAIANDQAEITAHLRCLPISYESSFVLTLHGNTQRQVLEILKNLTRNKTITLETVNKHLRDLGITEKDLLSLGFERFSRTQLSPLYLARTNFYYFKSEPLKYIKGFFQSDSTPDEYALFVRRRSQ